MLNRAYSLLDIKSIDEERRIIEGIASTPSADRQEDIVESEGAKYSLPLAFMWQHGTDPFVGKTPVGHVIAITLTKMGIPVRIQMAQSDRPGRLKDILDFAWEAVLKRLVRGLSIGFSPIGDTIPIKGTFGVRIPKWEWLELSAVTIPANAEASILTIKHFDIGAPKSGTVPDRPDSSAGVTALSPRRRVPAMNTSERITTLQAERKKTAEKMSALYQPVLDGTGDLSGENRKEYDGLKATLAQTDTDISDSLAFEQAQIAPKAMPVRGATAEEGAESRRPRFAADEGRAKTVLPPGIEFTRYVICKAAARIYGVSPLDIARERFPDNPRIQTMIKAAIAGGTTTDATWAAPLLQDVTTLTSEFMAYLRPRTIIGKFGSDGIPSLTRVPFYSRIQSQTSGGSSNWVGQGIQKPVTKFDFAAITLNSAKVAAISVLSDDLIRFSNPAAEGRVRDALTGVIVERLDRDFIDPDKAVDANVSPASITNGITGLTPSSGGDPDDVRTDVAALMGAFIGAHQDPTNLVWIMSNTSALQLSLMRNALGQREFPEVTVRGGSFEGFPIIASQYAALVGSPTPNVVILVNAPEIFLADDGGVTVDMSNEATIEMSDDPVNDTGTQVNMFQTNNVAFRAERYINWARGRVSAVAWLDAAAWSAAA